MRLDLISDKERFFLSFGLIRAVLFILGPALFGSFDGLNGWIDERTNRSLAELAQLTSVTHTSTGAAAQGGGEAAAAGGNYHNHNHNRFHTHVVPWTRRWFGSGGLGGVVPMVLNLAGLPPYLSDVDPQLACPALFSPLGYMEDEALWTETGRAAAEAVAKTFARTTPSTGTGSAHSGSAHSARRNDNGRRGDDGDDGDDDGDSDGGLWATRVERRIGGRLRGEDPAWETMEGIMQWPVGDRLFLGGVGTTSYPLHRDTCDADAFFAVIDGCKEFAIVDPKVRHLLERIDVPNINMWGDDLLAEHWRRSSHSKYDEREHAGRPSPSDADTSNADGADGPSGLSGRSEGFPPSTFPPSSAWRGMVSAGETLFLPGHLLHQVVNRCDNTLALCRRPWRATQVRDIADETWELLHEGSANGTLSRNAMWRAIYTYWESDWLFSQ